MSPAPAGRPCRAFLDDFSAFVDGQLPQERRDELQAHVDCCQGCLDHLTAYRRGITVLRSIDAGAPADFWERLERRLWPAHELTVVQGGEPARDAGPLARWPGTAVTVAAAAVLALFLIARGVGPDARPGVVGPRTVRASVAMTLPEVPEAGPPAVGSAPVETKPAAARGSSRRIVVASTALELPAEGFKGSLNRESAALVSDGWIEPVRLGRGWSRPGSRAVSLIRASAAVTPAPWNVDRAVSLP
jgi:hypothetical protein